MKNKNQPHGASYGVKAGIKSMTKAKNTAGYDVKKTNTVPALVPKMRTKGGNLSGMYTK